MKGETARKLVAGLAASAMLLFLAYSLREYGLARYAQRQVERGVTAATAGDIAAAERLFGEAVRANPKHAAAWLGLGTAARKRGKIEKALEAFSKAAELSGDPGIDKSARMGLAAIYGDDTIGQPLRQKDWYKKAVDLYLEAVEETPDDPVLRMKLGFAAFGAVNPGLGLNQMREASEMAAEPEYLWIHKRLLVFYQTINLKEEADRELTIIESYPGGASQEME